MDRLQDMAKEVFIWIRGDGPKRANANSRCCRNVNIGIHVAQMREGRQDGLLAGIAPVAMRTEGPYSVCDAFDRRDASSSGVGRVSRDEEVFEIAREMDPQLSKRHTTILP